MIKKLFTYVALVMSVFLLTACPSDDKEDDYNIDTSTSRFVGYWETSESDDFILYEEGIIRYLDGNSNIREASWNYNKETGLLATTALYGSNNWQWEVTMIEDNEWAGFALWLDDKKTMLIRRDNNPTSFLLLKETQWENDDYEIHFPKTDYNHFAEGYIKGSKKEDVGFLWQPFAPGIYHSSDDEYEFYLGNRHVSQKITISHPFSIKKSRMTVSAGDKPGFHCFKQGVYKRVK